MNNEQAKGPGHCPTVSIQTTSYPDGSYGVNVYLTGLTSQEHADAACEHMTRMFCGDEIKTQG